MLRYAARVNTTVTRHPFTWQPRLLLRISARSPTAKRPNKPFAPSYQPDIVEAGWYDWWESQGYFTAAATATDSRSSGAGQDFTMMTPPPNVTGSLHIGHALTLSIEDALARYRRMNGYRVSWIPGTDHAGIGTQSVVEKMLMRERGLTRHDIGREAFVREVWQWREKYGDHILKQMRRMGASVDWERTFFTMDHARYEAVQNAFIQLYKDGLIYRDTRLVNWCCALETVISDIEVEYKEIDGRTLVTLPRRPQGVEFGVLHQFAYPVVDPDPDGIQELIVSTTRIETMLGDCAVAIHPDDERYKSLHGKYVYHPIVKKKLPIICDDQLVDMALGTGAVKITPAHDPNDYACARRHHLPVVSIFDKTGALNENGGVPEWKGIDRFDLRDLVISKLQDLGLYKGKDDKHSMRVAICSRSGDVIEPLLQPQWYIRCGDLARTSHKQVESGEMVIHPSGHTQDWYRWLDNIQDWCISRQLWWGHEIPAYQIQFKDMSLNDQENWIVARDEETAHEEAQKFLSDRGLPKDTPYSLAKDEDVLDTWFSSGLLPLSALGWTGKPGEPLPARYPLQLMETGYDILFFWVARMAMLANHFAKRAPFENIFLHAMVRDAQGRKMSKSLGNVIDPLHVIEGVTRDTLEDNIRNSNLSPKEIERSVQNLKVEYPHGIPPCGTDALRFALIAYTQQSRQINLDISNVVQTSHFCNKLWNLFNYGFGRFKKHNYSNDISSLSLLLRQKDTQNLSLVNRYILSRMADTVAKCRNGFENYRLHEAADAVRRFIVEDVCDVYVEFSKANLDKDAHEQESTLDILYACMDISLRLAHPFMPFVTEELWHQLCKRVPVSSLAPSLMISCYPNMEHVASLRDEQVENHFQVVLSIIHASRSLRQGHQISVNKALPFEILCTDARLREPLSLYLDEIKSFTKASELTVLDKEAASSAQDWTMRAINDSLKILVPTSEVIRAQLEQAASKGTNLSVLVEQRQNRLHEKLKKTVRQFEQLQARMSKEGYAAAVPEKVKEKNLQKLKELELEKQTYENDIRILQKLSTEA